MDRQEEEFAGMIQSLISDLEQFHSYTPPQSSIDNLQLLLKRVNIGEDTSRVKECLLQQLQQYFQSIDYTILITRVYSYINVVFVDLTKYMIQPLLEVFVKKEISLSRKIIQFTFKTLVKAMKRISDQDRRELIQPIKEVIPFGNLYKIKGKCLVEYFVDWYGDTIADYVSEMIISKSEEDISYYFIHLLLQMPSNHHSLQPKIPTLYKKIQTSKSYLTPKVYCKHLELFVDYLGNSFLDDMRDEICNNTNSWNSLDCRSMSNAICNHYATKLKEYTERGDDRKAEEYRNSIADIIDRLHSKNGVTTSEMLAHFDHSHFTQAKVEYFYGKFVKSLFPENTYNLKPFFILPIFTLTRNCATGITQIKLLADIRSRILYCNNLKNTMKTKYSHAQLLIDGALGLYNSLDTTLKAKNRYLMWIAFYNFAIASCQSLDNMDTYLQWLKDYKVELMEDQYGFFKHSVWKLLSGKKLYSNPLHKEFVKVLINDHLKGHVQKLYNYICDRQFTLTNLSKYTLKEIEMILETIGDMEVVTGLSSKIFIRLLSSIAVNTKYTSANALQLLNIFKNIESEDIKTKLLEAYGKYKLDDQVIKNLLPYVVRDKAFLNNYLILATIGNKDNIGKAVEMLSWSYLIYIRKPLNLKNGIHPFIPELYNSALGALLKNCDYITFKHQVHNNTKDCIEIPDFKQSFQALPLDIQESIQRESRIFNNTIFNSWLDKNNFSQFKSVSKIENSSNNSNNSEFNIFNIYILKNILEMIYNDKATDRVWRVKTLSLVNKKFFDISSQILNQTTNRDMFHVRQPFKDSQYCLLKREQIKVLYMPNRLTLSNNIVFNKVEEFVFTNAPETSVFPTFKNLKRIKWFINYIYTYPTTLPTAGCPLEELSLVFVTAPISYQSFTFKMIEEIIDRHRSTLKRIRIKQAHPGAFHRDLVSLLETKKVPLNMLVIDDLQTFEIQTSNVEFFITRVSNARSIESSLNFIISPHLHSTIISQNLLGNIEKFTVNISEVARKDVRDDYFTIFDKMASLRKFRVLFSEQITQFDKLVELITIIPNLKSLKLCYKPEIGNDVMERSRSFYYGSTQRLHNAFETLFNLCSREICKINHIQLQYINDQSSPFFFRLDSSKYFRFKPVNDNHTIFIKQ